MRCDLESWDRRIFDVLLDIFRKTIELFCLLKLCRWTPPAHVYGTEQNRNGTTSVFPELGFGSFQGLWIVQQTWSIVTSRIELNIQRDEPVILKIFTNTSNVVRAFYIVFR